MPTRVLFLSWVSPWPPHGGATLRHFGILKEISKFFEVELVVLSRQPLSNEQIGMLSNYAKTIIRVPLRDVSFLDKLQVLGFMLKLKYPYHSAVLISSFKEYPDVLNRIKNFLGVVYASSGHLGTLVIDRESPNWILDQHNADVHFWRVYASQATNYLVKLASLVNWRLSNRHFPRIYRKVGKIISVCEEDRQLTLSLASKSQVHVIENGVDCSYYIPERGPRTGSPRILFTGTSVTRNVTSLRQFARNIWPLILQEQPKVELLVAGNFQPEAQVEFRKYRNIRFTGRVDDMRPYFNQSDVFIAPFEETHGSKLKIAEAMAMGMAIVSTSQGIRGFPLVDRESVLIAHNKEQFANHVVELLRSHEIREQLGKAARDLAIATIDWKVLGQRLREIIEEAYANLSC